MAYDSAAATDAASRAYQRAVAIANQNRLDLNQNYGVDMAGNLNGDRLGSIYQTGLGGVQQQQQASSQDLKRGFGSKHQGLAGRSYSMAHQGALDQQALGFRGAFQGAAQTEQAKEFAGQDYEGAKTQIASTAALDAAETLRQNQYMQSQQDALAALLAQGQGPPPSVNGPTAAQAQAAKIMGTGSVAAAAKLNPKIYQTIRNRY